MKQQPLLRASVSENQPVFSFTNRWLALAIDFIIIFTFVFAVKYLFLITSTFINWVLILGIHFIINILIPILFFDGITLGRKMMGIGIDYPLDWSPKKRALRFILRELVKIASILLTAGLILIVSGFVLMESNKRTLHEFISGVRVYRIPKKSEQLPRDDNFERFHL